MTKTNIKLIKASIAHWMRMRDGKQVGDERPSWHDCALCRKYFRDDCEGCPVAAWTKQDRCCDTPYASAEAAWHNKGSQSETFKRAAQKEITFLRRVLKGKR